MLSEKSSSSSSDSVLFHEEQRFSNLITWLPLFLVALANLFYFVFQPLSSYSEGRSALVILLPTALIVFCATLFFSITMRLITEVRSDGLYYRFTLFHGSFPKVSSENTISVQAVTYRPLRNYGRYGIRYTFKGKAYNVSGNRGLRIDYADGNHLLIGSQRGDELAQVIHANTST